MVEVIPRIPSKVPPFNNEIENLIKENKVMAVYDTLVKDGRMGVH